MTEDLVRRSLSETSDEELLAITSGVAPGYTEHARKIAEDLLRERCVELPTNLRELRAQSAVAESIAEQHRQELGTERDRAVARRLGVRLMIIGFIGLVPRIFSFRFASAPLGYALPIGSIVIVIAGYILFVRASDDHASTSPRPNEES